MSQEQHSRRDDEQPPRTVSRFAISVSGDAVKARMVAEQAGLRAEVRPPTTTARGWIPDQAALIGLVALMSQRGLEVAAAHRTRSPHPSGMGRATAVPPSVTAGTTPSDQLGHDERTKGGRE